jgi:glycerol-3-phosphate dehydrogenase
MTTPEQSTARPATPWAAGYRERLLEKLKAGQCKWDVIVVGGGITGAGILRECSRRGLQALLVEKKDFAWGTSSKSSKMVHGGLRYLATAQFGLTRDSVQERQRLMAEAPGLVDPLQFLMGHYKGQFPPGFIFNRVLDMYDLMAGKRNHRHYPARDGIYLAPGILENGLQSITQFGDAVTDDARLVLRVLHEAICEGAHALNYVGAVSVLRQSKGAGQNSPATGGSSGAVRGLLLKDEETGESFEAEASVVINATGAWADHLRAQEGLEAHIRPLRGSHLVLPHWRFPVAYSVSYFHPQDKRPVFVFPWEGTTVIGTNGSGPHTGHEQ